MVEKSQLISNLPISADLHGLLAPEESLNWKTCSQFSNTISPDITRPYTLLISENLITTVNVNFTEVNMYLNSWTKFPLKVPNNRRPSKSVKFNP